MATSPHCPPLADTAPPATGQVIRAATPASEGVWRRGNIPRIPSTVTSVEESMEPYGVLPSKPCEPVWVVRYETPFVVDGETLGTVPGFVWLRADEMGLVEVIPEVRPRATEAELCAIEDEYAAYEEWVAAEGLVSTSGLYIAWASLNDRGVNEQGLLVGAPW